MQEKIIILDFGSQYTQLIGRRVRELNVYCEIHPFNHYPEIDSTVKGVILSGSPYSVRDESGPRIDLERIRGKFPLLGVCYGAQYLAHFFGGEVAASDSREYGRANLRVVEKESILLRGITVFFNTIAGFSFLKFRCLNKVCVCKLNTALMSPATPDALSQ